MNAKGILLLLLFAGAAHCVAAQDEDGDTGVPPMALYVQVGKTLYKGDSIPDIVTPTLYKYPPIKFKSKRDEAKYNRLVNNVKRVLPYAKQARQILMETGEYLATLPDEKSRREHIDIVEKGIKEQYKPVVKKLTFSQGKLLVKLIYRECNQTSYEVVQAFLGSFKAGYYQFFAGLFGNSLKKAYDPEGDDKYTERVVRMVESGQL